MNNDIANAIETTTSTNNELNEKVTIPFELVDEEERFQDEYGDREPVTIWFRMKYKYNKSRLPTREKDIAKAIDIAAQTNNKENEDLCVAAELYNTWGGGDGDKGPVIIKFRILYQYQYQQQQQDRLSTMKKEGNREHRINKRWTK